MTQEEKEYLWPPLPLEAWKKTYETLHMWTQVVGKVKVELCPFLNQWWEVGFSVTAWGLTTSLIPSPTGAFQVTFDFINHNLSLCTSAGKRKQLALMPRSVADFYQHFMTALCALGIEVKINTTPSEVENPLPFEQDHTHHAYDPEYVNRWWPILVQVNKVFQHYRSSFLGKSSPVLFYWGSFDLAEARSSEKRVTPPPGAHRIVRLSETQEVIESGFWPGLVRGRPRGRLGRKGSATGRLRGRPRRLGSTQESGATLYLNNSERRQRWSVRPLAIAGVCLSGL